MNDERDRPKKRRRARARPLDAASSGEIPVEGLPFGRYHLLKRLSYGGMGEIFLAKHDGIGGFSKLLVIKRLLQHYRGDDDVVGMFFDEAKLQALMSDRHIVQIWDMGKVDEQYFIAMEYVEGTSWRRLTERALERGEALHPAHAVDLVVQACRGLGYAHELTAPDGTALSLVHRDVNPQNVLVSFAGECKVIDFGIAKSEMSGVHTETGTIKGKFAYMSPEQARAEPLDRRSDIFSMGICLYEMLAGENPFHRQNVVLSLEAICEHAPPPLEKVRPDAAALSPVVERCIAKNPDDRFASCAELEEALVSLYSDGFFGDPPEPLADLMQRLFEKEIAQQGTFLRQHGFSSITTKKSGAASDPGSPSPFGVGADVTKRSGSRRSRSGSSSLESPVLRSASVSERSVSRSRPRGDRSDTQPTATLALASLPSRTGERGPSLGPTEEEGLRTAASHEFTEDTDIPADALAAAEPPRQRGAARVALVIVVALLLSLAAALTLVAFSDEQTLDALLAAVSSPEADDQGAAPASNDDGAEPAIDEPAPPVPAAMASKDAGPQQDDVVAAAGAEKGRPDAGAPVDRAALAPAAFDAGAAALAAERAPAAEQERAPAPSLAEADDGDGSTRSLRTQRDKRRTTKRRSSRDKRADVVTGAEAAEPAAENAVEKAPESVGVLTVNAGGPYTIQGTGVRARNVAKASLRGGEARTITISGGPVKVKLRVVATSGGVEVRVDTDPWTIVRANNLGRGRTPQGVTVKSGQPMQLVLKHPEAGEMKVTLGFSSRTTR